MFGNKDVRALWQWSNFDTSKDLWLNCGLFDFSEPVIREILGPAERENGEEEEEEEEEEENGILDLFGDDDY